MVSRRIAALIVTVLALGASVGGAQDSGERFSADERRRLDGGELVSRPVARTRGRARLIGGSSFQVVHRSPSVTWRALLDAQSLYRMLPAGEESSTVARSSGERTVRLRHSAGLVGATYHLRLRYDHERKDISFRLDERRPNDLRQAWGFLSVSSVEGHPDRSLVSWGVMADLGAGLLGGVMRGTVHDWLMRVPSTIRDYLEGPARDRYED